MPTILALVGLALGFSVGIGVPAGILSAACRDTWVPGVGQLVVRSLYNRDLPVIQGLNS